MPVSIPGANLGSFNNWKKEKYRQQNGAHQKNNNKFVFYIRQKLKWILESEIDTNKIICLYFSCLILDTSQFSLLPQLPLKWHSHQKW